MTAATASVRTDAPPTEGGPGPQPTDAGPADPQHTEGRLRLPAPVPALSHDEAVAAARAIAPRLAAYAAEADRLRTLPAEAVRLLDDARLFDVLTPRVWGGGGLGFATALLTTEELSRGCASVGWLRAVMGGNTWTVAQFPMEARQEVFAAPSSRVALQLKLAGPPAHRVPGGYLLRGMWGRFCSGIDHAEWIVAGVSAPPAPGAEPEPHVVLLPQERTVGIDDWHTSGLRGTGSRSFTVPELLVPEHRVLPLSALDPVNPSPHGRPRTTPYRMAFAAVGTVALAGVLLGAARAALDSYAASPGGSGAGRLDVSALTATVDTARALLLTDLEVLAASSAPGGTPEERARTRRDIAYAGTRCREVVNAVYEASGSAVIYDDAPVQRIWRDANAAAQHPTFDLRRWGATPS
ncbi:MULTISPECIES: acyl-CoA dehydrogenase family protein [unclassified Streptomyces]|uniref:acyl-CoA dehydrogenase family protein n=1 Tax=unclassified Streptomyces TaxID=2593676 RepID=UPI00081DD411|nr:Acyl-CoA dehydrogenase [Streptomyces sp. ScaeMP-e83]